jgi:formylglycine-generating enzyme required for sulfatase activity
MRTSAVFVLMLLALDDAHAASAKANDVKADDVRAATVNTDYVTLPGGPFRTALKYDDETKPLRIHAFQLMRTPVTNLQYLAFVQAQPQWRRGRVAEVFAEPRYLSHWAAPQSLGGTALPGQPVVQVSWFAAQAYCAAQGARLPTWSEWEYAAAADETRRDARMDPAWRERILSWYSKPSRQALARAGLQGPNVYGVQDLHGLVWEWTEDFSSLLVSSDDRNQDNANTAKFCGAGALAMDDRENYAVLMRVAMLSSLEARDTTANLGFRCAKDLP